jgi:hypothetical protein
MVGAPGAVAVAATVRINSPPETDKLPEVLLAKPDPETVKVPGVPVTPVALPLFATSL